MLEKYLEGLTDQRQHGKVKHNLLEIAVMTIPRQDQSCKKTPSLRWACIIRSVTEAYFSVCSMGNSPWNERL